MPEIDPDTQLKFVHEFIDTLREQTVYPDLRSATGITERRLERALDAFASITERYKGRLNEDDTIRDVMYAIGFDTNDRCNQCGKRDCPDYLERLLEKDDDR
jgi:hypothetical protein